MFLNGTMNKLTDFAAAFPENVVKIGHLCFFIYTEILDCDCEDLEFYRLFHIVRL